MDWFRYYTDTIDNRKIQSLPGIMHRVWANFLCLNRIYGGALPNLETIAFRLRCTVAQAEKWRAELIDRKLIDPLSDGRYAMHEWEHYQYQSDDSRERVRAFRQRQKQRRGNGVGNDARNVTVTAQNRTDTETEAETETPPPLQPGFDFHGWLECQYARHPKKRDKGIATRYASESFAAGKFTLEEFESVHIAMCATDGWRWKDGAGAPTLAQWILDEGWRYPPAEPADQKSALAKAMEEI